MDNKKRLLYLEQLASLTLDYTYILEIDKHDLIVPEIIEGSFEKITGYSLSEIKEKNFFLSIIYEEDLNVFLEYWGKIISGSTASIIARILTKTNEIKWIKNYSKPIIDEETGRVVRILGAIQDITEQKLMEEILKESEKYYKTIIESMGEGLIIADNSDHIIYVNRMLCEMLGYDKKELIGKIGYNIFVDEENRQQIKDKNKLRKSHTSDTYETCFITRHGEKINVSISGAPLLNETGSVVGSIGIINDISEQRKYIEKLTDKTREITSLFEAGKYLSGKLDVNSIFEAVFEVVSEILDCSELFVARYDENDKLIKYIFLISRLGNEPIDVSKIPPIQLAPEGYGILSEVIRKSESVILNDYQQSLSRTKVRYNIMSSGEIMDSTAGNPAGSEVADPVPGKPNSALIIPIRFENQVLGVIQLYSEKKNAFSEVQLHFVETLMQQAALSYRNASLYTKAQEEILTRKETEKRLMLALEERELLIKEIFHRVKNNMQVISSLVRIQSEKIKDPVIKSLFVETRNRINAISLIHDKLYRSKDLSQIDFSDYISILVHNLEHMYRHNGRIEVRLSREKMSLPIDIAVPCGIILNELVTNSFKHAFEENSGEPKIEIVFGRTEENNYRLLVSDNGKGILDADYRNSNSLGLKLITTLAMQIDGKVKVENNNGTCVSIEFPPSKYRERI